MEKLLEVLILAKPTVNTEVFENATDLYLQRIIDSFDIMVIIDEINAAFDVEITGSSFTREDFRTVNDIYNMINRHKQPN